MSRETWKPQPVNLTARAAYLVPGNPAITRPEDAVANCYPGLELDIRNLDRRFFPGLDAQVSVHQRHVVRLITEELGVVQVADAIQERPG